MEKLFILIPGKDFSRTFLECWTLFILSVHRYFNTRVYFGYDPDIYTVRNTLLMATDKGIFDGADYDYILWIDSDMVFNFHHFQRLYEIKKDIASGLYLMEGGEYYTCSLDYKPGESGSRLSVYDAQFLTEPFRVAYNGLAFMLIKKGVFEAIGYPFFEPVFYVNKEGKKVKVGEDVGFCLKAREKGFDIWVHPQVKVGHEKRWIFV